MSERLEIEGKYYLKNINELMSIINSKNFKYMDTVKEKDEYFTDFDYNFIEDRTCLRLRTTNEKTVELTYKGKSSDLNNVYAKIEKNIDLNIKDYNNFVEILFALGYKSYVIVDKTRKIYTKKFNGIEFNVMIDNLKGVGDFVEFEIITDKSRKDAKNIFEKYIKDMNAENFEVVTLPYRDIVKLNSK